MLPHLSTSTPASSVSRADFERSEMTGNSDESQMPSLDDILRNSPAAKLIGIKGNTDEESLPTEEDAEETPEESSEENEEVPETDEDADDDSDEDSDQESTEEEEDEDDQESTQDADLPDEEDIDWEYKVPVKIDGKVVHVTLEEIRKGYATDQHLSQKGRELGELRKQLETERKTKLDELVQLGTLLQTELSSKEQELATEYHNLADQIKKAKAEGDRYTLQDLKEKQEEVQEQYHELRGKREANLQKIAKQISDKQAEEALQMRENFDKDIKEILPEFNEKLATSIREFAIEQGIPEELLAHIYDARVVKFINDYRKLAKAKDTGVQKRKATPKAKSIPTKKGPDQSVKAKRAEKDTRQRVLSGEASEAEQKEFLKRISKVSQKL